MRFFPLRDAEPAAQPEWAADAGQVGEQTTKNEPPNVRTERAREGRMNDTNGVIQDVRPRGWFAPAFEGKKLFE
jgi:hypothetical protein